MGGKKVRHYFVTSKSFRGNGICYFVPLKLFRYLEIISRERNMLFRSLEIILLQGNMLFHSLEIILRERNNIFRSNEMISREQNNIFRCPLRGSVPKPESSRNCVGLVKAHASLARQSEPPPMPSPSPQYALPFCHLAAQSQSREKMWGDSEKFHLLFLQSSTEKSIWHRLQSCYTDSRLSFHHAQLPMVSSLSLPLQRWHNAKE